MEIITRDRDKERERERTGDKNEIVRDRTIETKKKLEREELAIYQAAAHVDTVDKPQLQDIKVTQATSILQITTCDL